MSRKKDRDPGKKRLGTVEQIIVVSFMLLVAMVICDWPGLRNLV